MKKFLYIANWKMTVSPEKAYAFVVDNEKELHALSELADIVLCPSFISLGILSQLYNNKQINWFWGAQNCSEHQKGAFTGEIDALSLQQLKTRFCIVGHSERRTLFNETDDVIAQKVKQLITHDITPILCIGETQEQRQAKQTFQVLEQQLERVVELYDGSSKSLIIAYEPVWAIGTGVTPESEIIFETIECIKNYAFSKMSKAQVRCVYGGSVNQESVKLLKTLPNVDGFLIGAASSDFQMFKNIVV